MSQQFNYKTDPFRSLAAIGGTFELFDLEEGEQEVSGKAPAGPFGVLTATVAGRPFKYQFTADDVLWTARFLVGEAGGRDNLDNQAVIWAMLNRYALFTHRYYPTFHQFIRAYSTPLQPVLKSSGAARRHMHKKEFVRTGGNYPGTSIPRGQLSRFLKLQRTPWNSLPAPARALAERALKGQVANPIGNASEFASTKVYFRDRNKRWPRDFAEWQRFTETFAAGKKWVWVGPITGLDQMKNAFFVQQRVANLPAGTVRVAAATVQASGAGAPAGSRELFESEPEFDFEVSPVPPAPAEGPVKGITGAACKSGRGKCWPASGKSRDVIDADVPWNNSTNRSASNYEAVLDYFNVGNRKRSQPPSLLENARYRPTFNAQKKRWSTWCNIYVHDVTRAMWASVPHWVQQNGKWHELTANATFDWLRTSGRARGWIQIDPKLCGWIQSQNQTRASVPRPDPAISDALSNAAQQIARAQHPNQSLLLQPSYIAQQFGNRGLPVVAALQNKGGIGHVAMIRPERGTKRGVIRKNGTFVPRTAQAGGSNWTNELMTNMEQAMVRGKVLFFVHD
jgi:hypothetical protein